MNLLNNVNGAYQMTMYGSNTATSKTIIWDLGMINVWFKEG